MKDPSRVSLYLRGPHTIPQKKKRKHKGKTWLVRTKKKKKRKSFKGAVESKTNPRNLKQKREEERIRKARVNLPLSISPLARDASRKGVDRPRTPPPPPPTLLRFTNQTTAMRAKTAEIEEAEIIKLQRSPRLVS